MDYRFRGGDGESGLSHRGERSVSRQAAKYAKLAKKSKFNPAFLCDLVRRPADELF
jgi:hypothetical protein